jgi:hypothetical protein
MAASGLRARITLPLLAMSVALTLTLRAQDRTHRAPVISVPLQPLALQVRRLETTLDYLGQPLTASDRRAIADAMAMGDEGAASGRLQEILDPYALAIVHINPESRVSVEQGAARPELVQGGTRLFVVKVLNDAGVTAPLAVRSPNSGWVYIPSRNGPEPAKELSGAQVRERWADISMYDKSPMRPRLSGLPVEYLLMQVYSRDAGQRAATISFDVGQGTQDVGFRNDLDILFTALPVHHVRVHVQDEEGRPTTAAFLIRDTLGRLYPNASKRLAPDFFFQPQIYRPDGSTIDLPTGSFTIVVSRGPEYVPQTGRIDVPATEEVSYKLSRWIDPSRDQWFSGDHHIHAAGCSHYENPTEGVLPQDMWPQIEGEALNVACVLTWGPSYYYQKQFFSGLDHPLSTPTRLMHYDLEISGFPSSHAGHLVLLGLKDQDYPKATRLEDWPSWTMPVLQWAKAQGAVVGFAHSGWGLEVQSSALPNDDMPGFDGIGANEYIVDVTQPNTVDFISAGDTPYVWELNIWYHTLNVGFRTRISGETDFPCITDDRVGLARSYARVDGSLTYRKWIDAVQAGRAYVSDGRSHLMDFTVDGVALGTGESELRLDRPRRVKVSVRAAAHLAEQPNDTVRLARYDQKPYWDIERARIGTSREVPVEIVINGVVAAKQNLVADGQITTLTFEVPIDRSSWIAARILPSSHTNPIFAIVDGAPIRASRRSAQWCLDAVNQCWSQKAPRIRPAELDAARQAYDRARAVYRQRLQETGTSEVARADMRRPR